MQIMLEGLMTFNKTDSIYNADIPLNLLKGLAH